MKTIFLTRRAAMLLCLAALPLVFAPGCRRAKKVQVQATEEEAPRMASVVHMSDPKTAGQLVTGFYDVENNSWRWSQRRFSVVLRPPVGAAQRGANLSLKFTIPDVVIAKLKDVEVSAVLNGTALPPEKYTKPGEYTYTREVAQTLLTGESVRIDFTLDKAMAPGETDQRELGVVVASIGLELK
jgi:hypothetical protein